MRDATLYALINYAPQLAEAWQSQDVTRETAEAIARRTHFAGYQCKGDKTVFHRPPSPGGGNIYPQFQLQDDLGLQPKITGVLSRAPAIVIRGECEFMPAATAARFAAAFPAAQRVDIPGRGHAFLGHEAELSALLGRFAATTLSGVP